MSNHFRSDFADDCANAFHPAGLRDTYFLASRAKLTGKYSADVSGADDPVFH